MGFAVSFQVVLEKKGYDVNLLSIYNDPVYLKHHLEVESYTTRGINSLSLIIFIKGICT